jgi:hypothetical protein
MDTLAVSDYLSVVKDPKASDAGVPPPLTRADLEATLPRDLGERGSALDKMIGDRISKYLETRTIQLNMPTDLFEGNVPLGVVVITLYLYMPQCYSYGKSSR